MSIVYRPYSSAYADSCLNAAIAYYTVARISPVATGDANTTDGFYSWMLTQDYADNLGLGAIMLYHATGTSTYLSDAVTYASALTSSIDFTYGRVNHLLFLELYKTTKTTTYLDNIASRINGYILADCGYFHRTNWGSLRDAGCAAFLAALYHQITGDSAAYAFAKSNVDFILGSHDSFSNVPANFSFLIGYNKLGGGEPLYPHHGAAFGKKGDVWTIYNKEVATPGSIPFENKLLGGLAGGPETKCGVYTNNIDNYISNEFCSYYNAGFASAVSYVNKIENHIVQGVNEKVVDASICMYPNPVMNYLKINTSTNLLETIKINRVEISNCIGQILLSKAIDCKSSQIEMDVSNLPKGIYLVKLQGESIYRVQKIIKE